MRSQVNHSQNPLRRQPVDRAKGGAGDEEGHQPEESREYLEGKGDGDGLGREELSGGKDRHVRKVCQHVQDGDGAETCPHSHQYVSGQRLCYFLDHVYGPLYRDAQNSGP